MSRIESPIGLNRIYLDRFAAKLDEAPAVPGIQ